MSKRHWITSAGAGMVLLLTSCATHHPNTQAPPPAPQAFAKPLVPAKPLTLPPVKITGLIQTADRKALSMPVVAASNRDPFAAPVMPTTLRATIRPAPANSITAKAPTVRTQSAPQPTAQLVPQPAFQPAPQPTVVLNPTPMPPVSVSSLPALQPGLPMTPPSPPSVSLTNLASAIALTGVIQTGSKLSAIVQDTDGTPRYVQTGDTLADGQVTVKRINVNSAGLPSIVLQQNGLEFIRTVGSTEGSVAQVL